MTDRNSNGFRLSEAAIARWTQALVTSVIAVPMLAIALGFTSDADWAPEWLGSFAMALLGGGVVIPLFVGAVLGGEAIQRGGGLVGALFSVGLIAGPAGQVLGRPLLMYAGFGALAVACVGFFAMGRRAGVPMDIADDPGGRRRPPTL